MRSILMLSLQRDRWLLDRARGAIDGVDDGLILLLATRKRLVRVVAWLKARIGMVGRDPDREQRVHARAQTLAARVGVPDATARTLVDLAIGDACQQQGIAGEAFGLDAGQGRAT